MVNEEKLSVVLSEFARTVITDFPIQAILDHLVARIVEILPITSAGVTLISAGQAPHYIAASRVDALQFEQLQTDLDQGPCLSAFTTGEAVTIPDLANDDRFPRFGKAAVELGLAAAFTFPLRHDNSRLGALDLYRTTPGDLDAHDRAAAQTLADVTAAYIINAQARDDANLSSDRLHHLSMHDPLTGLPNRLLFQERIEHAALRATRSHTHAAVLFADLDHFKHVNDTHGHHVGDELLCVVAQRLAGVVRPGDTLARFSGDEFVILCEDLSDADDVEGLAARINETMSRPFRLSGAAVIVTASVGIAFAGPGEDISNQLVVEADRAMYAVKHNGRDGHKVVDVRSASPPHRYDCLEDDIRSDLAANHLDVAYQPIVRTEDKLVLGVEALLRWPHPAHGNISPLATVAIAEQTGLINQIGAWVLERACTDHARWLRENPDATLDLAVNVSARQLAHRSFPSTVAEVLSRTNMDPTSLILELTENVLIDDSAQVLGVLADLRAGGIRLALDDFGTGYSSMSYLARLPMDIVKIDRCFIADTSNTPGRTIVRAITNLAHDLGLVVVAEGVETHTQHDQIASLGCDSAQGYFYAHPMPASAIRAHHVSRLARQTTADDQPAALDHRHVARSSS